MILRAHRYGSSPSNQRIENWWSHFKRGYSSWIIDFFKQLVHDGKFILGNVFHMECAWFSFSHLIQRELDKTRHEWNTHFIRKSRHDTISGIPDELYFLPERKQYRDEGFAVSYAEINNILLHRDVVSESRAIQNVADNDLEQYFLLCSTSRTTEISSYRLGESQKRFLENNRKFWFINYATLR